MGAPAASASITISEVDEFLELLAATSGAGSAADRSGALRGFMARTTQPEQDFLARVLLGEMRTGALEGVLTDAIAKAANRAADIVRRAAMLSGNLGETARLALTGTPDQLAAVRLIVGRPVLPMLAASAPTAAAALAATGQASVEYKLDGARIQVHRAGDEVRIFTRNLADITHRLPEIVEVVRGMPVRDVILDGETLALDEDGTPRLFQDTMSRFGADTAGEARLHARFFDVLHVDGRDLLDEPLSTRLAELYRVAGGFRIPGEVTADPEVAERVSREALAAGQEGVIVKAI